MRNIQRFAVLLVVPALLFAGKDPRMEQGARFVAAGKYEMALGEYRAILVENPRSAEAYFAAAEVRVKMKKYKDAVENYRLAYQYNPSMKEAYQGAAKAFKALGQKDSANAELQKMRRPGAKADKQDKSDRQDKVTAKSGTKDKFDYSGDLFKKGRSLYAAKKYDEAGKVWKQVLAKEPGNPGAYYFSGVARYEAGEMDKAEYNLKKSFDYPELGYNAHYYLSLIYKQQGKADKEKAELEKFAELSSNPSAVASAKARIKVLSGDKASAVEKAQSAKAEKSVPAAASSSSTAESSTSATEASSSSMAVVPAPPAPPVSADALKDSLALANTALKAKKLDDALALYRSFLELSENEDNDDDQAFALMQIGNIFRERRDFHSAVDRYREIVENHPDSEWASEAQRAWEDAVWLEKNADKLPREKR
jgi:tetratricopeptide (TPR) repeat protein